MHYATFKMAYLSAKKALMTFRITIHFSGSSFSPEVLGSLSEKCNFQHTPHMPLQHTNTILICSVLKYHPLCTKPGSFGEQDIKKIGLEYRNSTLCKAIQVLAKIMRFFSGSKESSEFLVQFLTQKWRTNWFFERPK